MAGRKNQGPVDDDPSMSLPEPPAVGDEAAAALAFADAAQAERERNQAEAWG
jgi:hypothetical protein